MTARSTGSGALAMLGRDSRPRTVSWLGFTGNTVTPREPNRFSIRMLPTAPSASVAPISATVFGSIILRTGSTSEAEYIPRPGTLER